MKGLIIAAGEGRRIKSLRGDSPKPLIRLLGLTLIERVILSAKEAGISEFIIVIGYKGEDIKNHLGGGEEYGVKITYIENEEWEEGNGVSVVKARSILKDEPFLLLMADHIFDSSIIETMLKVKKRSDECLVAIDSSPRYIDLSEATKVKIDRKKIVDIGKNLEVYDAVDCGIFLMSPVIFEALEESIRGGDDSLAGGLRFLASKKLVRYIDVKNTFWIDVDTEEDYKRAERELLRRLTKPTDGPVSRYLNRPLSTRLSKYLVETRIPPTLISIISFLLSFPAAYLFCASSYISVVLAGLLAQFSSILDGIDGEIARLKHRKSTYGAWLDSCLDRYSDAIIIFGMTYGWWLQHDYKELTLIIGFIALIGSFMNSYTSIRYDSLIEKHNMKMVHIGRDVRILLIMIGALFNQILLTLLVLAIFTNLETIRRLIVVPLIYPSN